MTTERARQNRLNVNVTRNNEAAEKPLVMLKKKPTVKTIAKRRDTQWINGIQQQVINNTSQDS